MFSNKIDVIRFMNKHNIKWFENQRAININAQIDANEQQLNHKMDIKIAKQSINDSNNANRIKITALPTSSTTVIPTTIPPILNKHDVIEHTPVWKSLIDKIKTSNSNDLNDNGDIKTVHKQSTVEAIIYDTTHFIPPKITSTTERSFQRTSNSYSHNADLHIIRTDNQQGSMVSEHPDKTQLKSAKNIKPEYSWTYLDPSIVYRALTSPVSPTDHYMVFILMIISAVLFMIFFIYCIVSERMCRCCWSRRQKVRQSENEIHEVSTTLLANHDYSDED